MDRDSLVICRCEDVTEGEIRKAIREGAINIDALKRRTRAGMGLCQSRTCMRLVAQILSEETGKGIEAFLPIVSRVPVRAVQMSVLSEDD